MTLDSNTCSRKQAKYRDLIHCMAVVKFSPLQRVWWFGMAVGVRGGSSPLNAELIGWTHQKIQSRWMMKCELEMCARSDICIFPFEPFSARHCHLIQPLRSMVHFKSDVWLAPPGAILIEMSFGCTAGEPGPGTCSCVRVNRSESVVGPISLCGLMIVWRCP